MIDTATALGIAGLVASVVGIILTIKFRNKPKPARRRKTPRRTQDPLSVKLDLSKPDLGLNDEKIKRIGLAWFLNKLIDNNRERDAI